MKVVTTEVMTVIVIATTMTMMIGVGGIDVAAHVFPGAITTAVTNASSIAIAFVVGKQG